MRPGLCCGVRLTEALAQLNCRPYLNCFVDGGLASDLISTVSYSCCELWASSHKFVSKMASSDEQLVACELKNYPSLSFPSDAPS